MIAAVEAACFPEAEVASRERLAGRIERYPVPRASGWVSMIFIS